MESYLKKKRKEYWDSVVEELMFSLKDHSDHIGPLHWLQVFREGSCNFF